MIPKDMIILGTDSIESGSLPSILLTLLVFLTSQISRILSEFLFFDYQLLGWISVAETVSFPL